MTYFDQPELEQREAELLQSIRETIDATVDEAYEGEYDGLTQESPLTADIAAAIRTELKHHPLEVDGLKVEVATRNVPDRGRGSIESKIGADLYVSVVRHVDGESVSKGILIQAKWDKQVRSAGPQINDMLALTEEAYVLVYRSNGPIVVPARGFSFSSPVTLTATRGLTLGTLLADGLKCNRGDELIGRPLVLNPKQGMDQMLRSLAAKRALALRMTDSDDPQMDYSDD
jgi:hypothetical protein